MGVGDKEEGETAGNQMHTYRHCIKINISLASPSLKLGVLKEKVFPKKKKRLDAACVAKVG